MASLSYEDRQVLEEAVVSSPYDVRKWCDYIDALHDSTFRMRSRVYERAITSLPGSYKLWMKYLMERKKRCRSRRITDARYEKANRTFERALVFLHKMPKVWEEYCELLMEQRLLKRSRLALDEALKALPVTQHDRIWKCYLRFAMENALPTALGVNVFKRYLMFDPTRQEEYLEYLLRNEMYAKAAVVYSEILQNDNFVSVEGKNAHAIWMELCTLLSQHADEVSDSSLNIEGVLRTGLKKFSDETGRLWCCMADYYIRLGEFEQARGVYEEAINTVLTVRDFSTVFDAYTQFQEALLSAKIEAHTGEQVEQKAEDESYYKICLDDDPQVQDKVNDVDMLLGRLEHLLNRRPLLLNSVMLRQNPNDVDEWHKRAKIYEDADDLAKVVVTYADAVKTVVPYKSSGKAHTLWIALAQFYEKHNDKETNEGLGNAVAVFERAVKVVFRKVEHLAEIYCVWAEMEIKYGRYANAHKVIEDAITPPSNRERIDKMSEKRQLMVQGRAEESKEITRESQPAVFTRLHRSTKLWSLYIDLEESLGSLKTTRAAYERMIALKVATPETILNYAKLLEENDYFEESFRCFEKGVALFPWPNCNEIWLVYLGRFVHRYKGKKLDRARELFEEALKEVPPEMCKPFYLLYAELEENYGLSKRAMQIYERLCDNALEEDRLDCYILYISKVTECYGLARTRPVFERGVEMLGDLQVKDLSVYFCIMERNLGEIDRARAILRHGSQFADPKVSLKFWKFWHEFEVAHGNEDTFREMLRIKRTVSAQYSADVSTFGFVQEEDAEPASAKLDTNEIDLSALDSAENKRKAEEDTEEEQARSKKKSAKDAEDANLEIDLEQQNVPSTVFGDAIQRAREESKADPKKKMGAMDRFSA